MCVAKRVEQHKVLKSQCTHTHTATYIPPFSGPVVLSGQHTHTLTPIHGYTHPHLHIYLIFHVTRRKHVVHFVLDVTSVASTGCDM